MLSKPSFDICPDFLVEYLGLSHPLSFLRKNIPLFPHYHRFTCHSYLQPRDWRFVKNVCQWQNISHPFVSCKQCILNWGPKSVLKELQYLCRPCFHKDDKRCLIRQLSHFYVISSSLFYRAIKIYFPGPTMTLMRQHFSQIFSVCREDSPMEWETSVWARLDPHFPLPMTDEDTASIILFVFS